MSARPTERVTVQELGVGDIARARGIHRNTARAWLKELHTKYGEAVVYRRSGRFYTTAEAVSPFATPAPSPKTVRVVNEHSDRLRDLERRLDAEVAARITFQRLALKWYERIERLEKNALSRTAVSGG